MRPPGQDITKYHELEVRMAGSRSSTHFWVHSPSIDDQSGSRPGFAEPIQFERPIPVYPSEVERALASISHSTQGWVQSAVQRVTLDPLKEIGMRLFTTLFEGKPTYLYNDLLGRAGARDQREGLRLRLVTDEPDLAALPWEFLYDVYRENFVALSGNMSVVRQRRTETHFGPVPPLKPPLRLLIVHSESKNHDEVEALHRLEGEAEALEMQIIPVCNLEAIRQELHRDFWHVLHVVGDCERTSWPEPEALFLRGLHNNLRELHNLRLLYLSVNRSADLAFELSASIPAIFGVEDIITPRSARFCTEGFYRALLAGLPLEAAVTQGRQTVDRESPGRREWGLSVFYLQVPEGTMLMLDDTAAEAANVARPARRTPEIKGSESGQRKRLELQLNVLQQNLRTLEQQKLLYGAHTPPTVEKQLEKTKADLARVQAEIAQPG